MQRFQIRPAVETDQKKIHLLIRSVGINPLDLHWSRFLVAELYEGAFIGCAQLKPHGDGSLELASLAVDEHYRSQGVARALIERLLAVDTRPLYLMCLPALRPLYEKFAFRVIEMDAMPPYFRRVTRLMRVMTTLGKHQAPLVMRLD